MFKAISGDKGWSGRALSPIAYYELSRLNAVSGNLKCHIPTCRAPAYFYGVEAAEREIVGTRQPGDVIPSFHHWPGTGENCPEHNKERRVVTEEECAERLDELAKNAARKKIQFDHKLVAFTISVWAHMFGQRGAPLSKFNEIKNTLTENDLFGLGSMERWRVPYAMARKASFYAPAENELKLVSWEAVNQALLNDREKREMSRRHGERIERGEWRDTALYVIYTRNRMLHSSPLELTEKATRRYAGRNKDWAYEQLNPRLDLALAS